MTAPQVRESKMPPWIKAHAKLGDRWVVLVDLLGLNSILPRYGIGAGQPQPPIGSHAGEVGFDLPITVLRTDDAKAAWAAYHAECERMVAVDA